MNLLTLKLICVSFQRVPTLQSSNKIEAIDSQFPNTIYVSLI